MREERRASSREQEVESVEQRARSREQGAYSKEQRARSREQGASSKEQRARSREGGTESEEQRARSREGGGGRNAIISGYYFCLAAFFDASGQSTDSNRDKFLGQISFFNNLTNATYDIWTKT